MSSKNTSYNNSVEGIGRTKVDVICRSRIRNILPSFYWFVNKIRTCIKTLFLALKRFEKLMRRSWTNLAPLEKCMRISIFTEIVLEDWIFSTICFTLHSLSRSFWYFHVFNFLYKCTKINNINFMDTIQFHV